MRSAVVGGLLVSLLTAGCGSFSVTPRPGASSDILAELAVRGAQVTDVTSGDPGCQSPELVGNAVRARVAIPGDEEPRLVHLLVFRNGSALQAAAAEIASCRQEVAADNGDADIDVVEVSPYSAFGPDWSPEFERFLESAMRTTVEGSRRP